jgi:hypothetical protein
MRVLLNLRVGCCIIVCRVKQINFMPNWHAKYVY